MQTLLFCVIKIEIASRLHVTRARPYQGGSWECWGPPCISTFETWNIYWEYIYVIFLHTEIHTNSFFLPFQCVCAPGGGEAVVHSWRNIMHELHQNADLIGQKGYSLKGMLQQFSPNLQMGSLLLFLTQLFVLRRFHYFIWSWCATRRSLRSFLVLFSSSGLDHCTCQSYA